MEPITLILGLISGATQVLQAYKGTAAAAKTTAYVQEAIGTITSLVPLVQSFGDGKTVTLDDARSALAGMNTALAKLEADIAAAP